jgi:hypothetical protein
VIGAFVKHTENILVKKEANQGWCSFKGKKNACTRG